MGLYAAAEWSALPPLLCGAMSGEVPASTNELANSSQVL